jgi:hypothetical protein
VGRIILSVQLGREVGVSERSSKRLCYRYTNCNHVDQLVHEENEEEEKEEMSQTIETVAVDYESIYRERRAKERAEWEAIYRKQGTLRTLEDMDEETIKKLEAHYKCKIKRPAK